jgi:hypothetical protein
MIPLLLFLLAGEQAGAPLAPMKVPATVRQTGRVAPGTMTPLEKRFNERLTTLFDANDPVDLLGNTRGVYLDNYGAVFTAEVSLVTTPASSPFRGKISKEYADSIRQKKIQRLPFLKAVMKEMMHNMAATFLQVPNDQQMVLVVRFWYEPWEDLNGMPSQIAMHADRTNALKGDVQVEEQ